MTHKKRKIIITFLILIFVPLIAARMYLPYWVKDYVNGEIAKLDGYGGGIEDIDIHLWRGAYQIHGLNIHKDKGGLQEPFVSAETADLSVEWRALLNGAVVAEIDLYNADLNFANSQTGQGAGWAKFVDALSPLDINRLEVHGGKIAYINYAADPNVNLYVRGIEAKVVNLRNVTDEDNALPSDVAISGTSIGGGNLSINGAMNILKDVPDFDLSGKLDDASLPEFNDYARSYAAIDFEEGSLGIYSELAASNGRVVGYVKPVATGVSVVNIERQDSNPFNAIWESLVSVFIELFENQERDQFALRIPIEGDLNNPEKDMWSGFISIFENAFTGAFSKDTDGFIEFMDAVETQKNEGN